MLESWSIPRRIGSGFAILTFILVGLALFSHRSVGALGHGYSEYRTTAQQAAAVSDAIEDLSEAKIATLSYVERPVSAERDKVISSIDEVLNNDVLTDGFDQSSALATELGRLTALTQTYRDQFFMLAGQLADVRAQQAEIDTQATLINARASSVFSAAVENGSPLVVTTAGQLLQATIATVLQSKRYVLSGTTPDFEKFVEENAALDHAIQQMQAMTVNGSVNAELVQLVEDSDGFADKLLAFSQARATALEMQDVVMNQIGPEVDAGFTRVGDELALSQTQLGQAGTDIVTRLQMIIPTVGIIAVIIAIMAALFIGRWITGTVAQLVATTERLAAGEDDIAITGTEHKHELGRMARALLVFRDAQVERKEASAERAKLRAQQDNVVNIMKSELAELAAGDLTAQIVDPFSQDYEDLRRNFNDAIAALQSAISRVSETARHIASTATDSNTATTDLSRRTENQAATLEQTAAALDQLTASVKSAAEHAKAVDSSVTRARAEATRNGDIVARAVSAMGEIEESSKQISQVIGVIDDIAFQTNLLALNAGVEAARAGESGKGFAVVASEVRALAQRSADAAKEISGLIENSSRHVAQGTQLVGDAGEALSEIITQVNDISAMTSQIATSAEEQAIGLSEINTGVNQLDQATQQNAAMVEDSIKRGDTLASATERLNGLIRHFKTSAGSTAPLAAVDEPDALTKAIAKTHIKPTLHSPQPKLAAISPGGAQPNWEEF
ncbi:methyl-accepting chemotaxis protein [Yoonia maricola]|uniref:Methyl-accepting chemotaxis protein n=1 Tax=Yoonia maricola TaxID=420999 RepID=A0A2M8WMF4_9RHOB|nr:methyl-accepting chemotaxis protein [Yoonia maricola]PJI92109.1 methyl-accepting chemotaxis protein [Yoonia maricola]